MYNSFCLGIWWHRRDTEIFLEHCGFCVVSNLIFHRLLISVNECWDPVGGNLIVILVSFCRLPQGGTTARSSNSTTTDHRTIVIQETVEESRMSRTTTNWIISAEEFTCPHHTTGSASVGFLQTKTVMAWNWFKIYFRVSDYIFFLYHLSMTSRCFCHICPGNGGLRSTSIIPNYFYQML